MSCHHGQTHERNETLASFPCLHPTTTHACSCHASPSQLCDVTCVVQHTALCDGAPPSLGGRPAALRRCTAPASNRRASTTTGNRRAATLAGSRCVGGRPPPMLLERRCRLGCGAHAATSTSTSDAATATPASDATAAWSTCLQVPSRRSQPTHSTPPPTAALHAATPATALHAATPATTLHAGTAVSSGSRGARGVHWLHLRPEAGVRQRGAHTRSHHACKALGQWRSAIGAHCGLAVCPALDRVPHECWCTHASATSALLRRRLRFSHGFTLRRFVLHSAPTPCPATPDDAHSHGASSMSWRSPQQRKLGHQHKRTNHTHTWPWVRRW